MNQHEWVYGCYAYYLENHVEPGNPEDGVWEDAHWPVPKCKGGTKTIPLLKQHHAVQGVLQSEEWQYPCIRHWEKFYLSGELLDLYNKWRSEAGRLGNVAQKKSLKYRSKRSQVMRERWNDPAYRQERVNAERERWNDPAYRQEQMNATRQRWEDPAYRQKRAEEMHRRWEDPEYKAKQLASLALGRGGPGSADHLRIHSQRSRKPVEAILPTNEVKVYQSLSDAVRSLGIPSRTIRDAIGRGAPTRSGYSFRYLT